MSQVLSQKTQRSQSMTHPTWVFLGFPVNAMCHLLCPTWASLIWCITIAGCVSGHQAHWCVLRRRVSHVLMCFIRMQVCTTSPSFKGTTFTPTVLKQPGLLLKGNHVITCNPTFLFFKRGEHLDTVESPSHLHKSLTFKGKALKIEYIPTSTTDRDHFQNT